MKKKKFIAVGIDSKDETFLIHIAFMSRDLNVYSFYKTYIAYLS